jgi:hypothetical protein
MKPFAVLLMLGFAFGSTVRAMEKNLPDVPNVVADLLSRKDVSELQKLEKIVGMMVQSTNSRDMDLLENTRVDLTKSIFKSVVPAKAVRSLKNLSIAALQEIVVKISETQDREELDRLEKARIEITSLIQENLNAVSP